MFSYIFVQKFIGFLLDVYSLDKNLHDIIFFFECFFYPCLSETVLFFQIAGTEYSALNLAYRLAAELIELGI